jgi:chemotaxis signal transduction protein
MDMLICSTDNHYYALPVTKVVRVMWALEMTSVPESPKIVCGVFDLHGKTISVISLRDLLSLPKKNMDIDDTLIIINVHGHQMALLCDHVIGVLELEAEDSTEAQELFPELAMAQVVKYEERLIPLLDIDTLLDHEIDRVSA